MSTVRLFVYGSLRRDGDGRAHQLLSEATFLGSATVGGTLYRVDWYPGLVLGDEGVVHGELYELPTVLAQRILGRLDDYEGGGFRRRKVRAECADAVADGGDGTSVGQGLLDAWAYAYIGPRHALPRIESGDYGPPVHRARP